MSSTPPPPPPLPGPDSSWNQAPMPAPVPAPPLGAPPPPPPPGFSAAPPMAPAYGLDEVRAKPPRPEVKVAAILMMIGGVVAGLGTFLPWLKVDGQSRNGLDDFVLISDGELKILFGPGRSALFFAVAALAAGLTLYFARRVLAVAIIAIILMAIGSLFAGGLMALVGDAKDLAVSDGSSASVQFGLYFGLLGLLLALAGAITATAKRRR